MFNNIGKKIKILAKVIMWILIAGCIIAAIVLFSIDDDLVAIGLPVLFGGPVVAWISCWYMYAFGQLVENSDKLVKASDDGNLKGIRTSNVYNEQKSADSMIKGNIYGNTSPNNSYKSRTFDTNIPIIEKTTEADIECPNCHQRQAKSRHLCFKCGKRFINKNTDFIPFWCQNCGNPGPFEENCPECGSSSRVYR